MIADNLKAVTQRIATCCERSNRSPEDIVFVCVTKEAGIKEIEEVVRSGVKDLGENRVQDALLKYKVIGNKARWHLVGHLQTNKAKDAVRMFSLIHSVDSERIARAIDKEAEKINKIQDVLVQVNVSGEDRKYGIAPDEFMEFLKVINIYPNINMKGLMTIAPEVDDPDLARPYFKRLRELKNEIYSILNTQYSILSMGMSNDFEVAIEEGSNMVRIGRAIFKKSYDK
ncbi:MAG: YggS family pyridoxal phosphate-dependent enzyme [Candidatus Omnitrophica bacterium]|nr:YggS family pyridoxal phosphate-dependent enzyme [Candidatus Omnitrophota bacterium]